MIHRIYDDLDRLLKPNKAVIILGPRRVGKTTLLTTYLQKTKYKYRLESGENLATCEILGSQDFDQMLRFISGCELLAIDEAQRIPNIAMGLKILVDHAPGIRIVATGSSAFDIMQYVGEPLVGRKRTVHLYPISHVELREELSPFDLSHKKEDYLVFGSYPEVLLAKSDAEKREILIDIANSYLFKDILEFHRIKGSSTIRNLVRLVAFQVGREVSLSELGQQLLIDVKTVDRYLDLLEKSFVIKRLWGYSSNMRKAVSKKGKIYFLDNGIRNAVILNFNRLMYRDDIGRLWENFLISERLKKQEYQPVYADNYFWRTWDKKEIDWVEMRDGKLFGYEFTWGKQKKSRSKVAWLAAYPGQAEFMTINQDNYLEFIT